MADFLNHVAIEGARNGTLDHNGMDPSTGTVKAGSTRSSRSI